MNNVSILLKSPQTTIVDVRTPAEFMGGHVAGSVNIPLNEIPHKISEFKSGNNIVLCCASGGRSAQAAMYLKQQGINCEDGGSWLNVNYLKNN